MIGKTFLEPVLKGIEITNVEVVLVLELKGGKLLKNRHKLVPFICEAA